MARPTIVVAGAAQPDQAQDLAGGDLKEIGPTSPATSSVHREHDVRAVTGGVGKRSDSERPTISWTSAAGLVSATRSVVTRRPSRSTVTRSAIRKTSSRRWVT